MPQQPDLFQEPPHERLAEFSVHNQKLFSSYYLAYRLPEQPLWRELEAEAHRVFKRIKDAYQDMVTANLFSAKNEAETERVFIRPVLKALGFNYFSVQPPLDGYDTRRWPDYALFPDQESYETAQQHRENMRIFYGKAVAIGEAKYWGRRMNDPDPSDPADISDATKQLVSYLRDIAEWTDGKTNWGILTNGKLWRLFHRRADYTAESYVEIDLEAIIQEGNFEGFKYFYALFSHEAFVTQALEGNSWLESYLKGSEAYSRGITKHLKELVFEKVFDGLVRGFVQYRREKLGIPHEDEASKRAIFQGCLTLLYRLLFLLNAESRQLLPMDNWGYRERSLRALMERIWEEGDEKRTKYDFDYWLHIKRLFSLIDNGASGFDLPRYNGGLFKRPDPNTSLDQLREEEIGPWFLEKHELADPYLRDAIEQLTFAPEMSAPSARAFIDYSSLGVRHLGEIYEGLLEFKVEIAEDEPVCAVGTKKKPQWKKQSEITDEDTILLTKQIGEPYITNDKGERKATGSYYTPHYIVQYIVEHTLGPQLSRFERERKWHDKITRGDADLQTLYEEIMEETVSEEERERLDTLWQSCKGEEERRACLLSHLEPDPKANHNFDPAIRALRLKVLDPAMGSGHFLVHAVAVIADRVVQFLNEYPDSPVVGQLERLRAGILENVQEQGVRIDESKLNDVNLIKRMVLKRCIYGVDVNPMAVELAKLSLWLDSFTVGAPLSFLDHHLRCGNSLIGVGLEEVKTALQGEKKGPAFHLSLLTSQFTGVMRAVELMQQVGKLTDATIPELEESQTRYKQAIAELAPFKAMLDVWVSEYFGNHSAQETLKQAPEEVEEVVSYLLHRKAALAGKTESTLQLVQEALQISKERRFFHWELEFPEVWYEEGERRTNPGFDAVIGNPPWGVPCGESWEAIRARLTTASGNSADSYGVFIELCLLLTRKHGYASMITPDTYLRKDGFVDLRNILLRKTTLIEFVETGPLFEDVQDTWCAVFCVTPSICSADHRIVHKQIERSVISAKERLDRFVNADWARVRTTKQHYWQRKPFHTIGYMVGDREQLALQKIEYYSVPLGRKYWDLAISRGEEGSRNTLPQVSLPNAFWFLSPEHIERHFCETGYRVDPSDLTPGKLWYYSRPKIWVIRIQKLRWRQRIVSAFDARTNSAANKTLQVIASRDDQMLPLLYVQGVLASRLINFWATDYLVDDMNQTYLERIPIRRIFFTTREAKRAEEVERFRELYQQGDFDMLLEAVEACLPKGDNDEFIVFDRSIPVEQAIEKGFLTEEQAVGWSLESGDPSGYDENGNPLEHSDVVRDLLAYLAERMIEMNKDKREIIERFWTDLEGITDSETFEKLCRGKQERTLANGSEACSPFVSAESGSTKHLDESLAWSEDAFRGFTRLLAGRIGNLSELVEVYRKHAPDQKELVQRIEATDELIDQIVYRLYGLTEDEIGIVEGAGNAGENAESPAWRDEPDDA